MTVKRYPAFTEHVLFYQYNTTEELYKENKKPDSADTPVQNRVFYLNYSALARDP